MKCRHRWIRDSSGNEFCDYCGVDKEPITAFKNELLIRMLKELSKKTDIKKKEINKELGLGENTLRRILTNEHMGGARFDNILKIAKYLNIEIKIGD